MFGFNGSRHKNRMADIAVEADSQYQTTKGSYDLDVTDPRQAIEFVSRAVKVGREALSPWYADATQNLAYAAGHQLEVFEKATDKMVDDPRYQSRDLRLLPFHVNLIRQYLARRLSAIDTGRATWTATSTPHGQRADIEAAKGASKLLPFIWKQVGMDNPDGIASALWDFFCTGSVYAMVEWVSHPDDEDRVPRGRVVRMVTSFAKEKQKADPDYLEKISYDPEAMYNDWIREELGVGIDRVHRNRDGSIRINRGRLEVKFYNGFQVVEDLSVKRWDEKRFFIIITEEPVSEVRERHGDKAKHVTGRRHDAELDDKPFRSMTSNRILDRLDTPSASIYETTVVIRTYWRRTESLPDGWFSEQCEGREIASGPLRYDHSGLTLIPMFEFPDTYDLRPSSLMTDLRAIQRAINKLYIQITYRVDYAANPTPIVEYGSVSDDFLTKAPVTEEYKRGFRPPTFMELPPFPVEALHELDRLTSIFKELGGLTNPALGQPTQEAKSGVAIQALQDAADLFLNVAKKSVREGLRRIGEQMLLLWAQFAPEETTFAVGGDSSDREMVSLIGESLISRQQNSGPARLRFDIDVDITEKPGPEEVQRKLDFVLERGILNPVEHQSSILRALETMNTADLDPTESDRLRVDEEHQVVRNIADAMSEKELSTDDYKAAIDAFSGGVELSETDNHTVHRMDHSRFINRNRSRLPAILTLMMEGHVRQHAGQEAAAMAARPSGPEDQQAKRRLRPMPNGPKPSGLRLQTNRRT